MQLDKYIEIRNISNPEEVFERLEGEFIDIMYPERFSDNSVIMLLDVGIDSNNADDVAWLKRLLDTVLPGIGEKDFSLFPL